MASTKWLAHYYKATGWANDEKGKLYRGRFVKMDEQDRAAALGITTRRLANKIIKWERRNGIRRSG